MKQQLNRAEIVLKKSQISGYGVFAAQNINENTLIEECHVLKVEKTVRSLMHYVFFNPSDENSYLLALGFGSIYNHSHQPNASFLYNAEDNLIHLTSTKLIKKGEEITIYYGDNWFANTKVKEIRLKPPSYRPLLTVLIRGSLSMSIIYLLLLILNQLPLLKLSFF